MTDGQTDGQVYLQHHIVHHVGDGSYNTRQMIITLFVTRVLVLNGYHPTSILKMLGRRLTDYATSRLNRLIKSECGDTEMHTVQHRAECLLDILSSRVQKRFTIAVSIFNQSVLFCC